MSLGDKHIPHTAFTEYYPARQKLITTKCRVGNPYDPSADVCEGIALWDTGATNTAIHPQLAAELKLIPIDRRDVREVISSSRVNVYIVNLVLGKVGHIVDMLELNVGKSDILVGMDIIGIGDFSICDGRVFSYCFPPCENPIDLEGKAQRVNKRMAAKSR